MSRSPVLSLPFQFITSLSAAPQVHQPSGGASGQAADIAIHAAEIIATRTRLNELYSRHTGQSTADIGEWGVTGQLVCAESATSGCRGCTPEVTVLVCIRSCSKQTIQDSMCESSLPSRLMALLVVPSYAPQMNIPLSCLRACHGS